MYKLTKRIIEASTIKEFETILQDDLNCDDHFLCKLFLSANSPENHLCLLQKEIGIKYKEKLIKKSLTWFQ